MDWRTTERLANVASGDYFDYYFHSYDRALPLHIWPRAVLAVQKEEKMTKNKAKKTEDLEQQLGELTLDLQRTRADFENYRKRVEAEKQSAHQMGQAKSVMKLLPVIDTIERAIANVPEELQDNAWAKGVAGLNKQLDKQLKEIGLEKINAKPGTLFNPELHQAVQFDEEAEGDKEVIAEELRAGYTLDGVVIRDAMVKVTRQSSESPQTNVRVNTDTSEK
ncbi:nucleotide exchange factor GrpE [Candidatus Saccharibacteria bacterium oral taxon 488]|nr:nucleotide exchange factor GrpE [Candidatus Saccharibacteria bacterium oral taxon 488]